MAFKIIADSCCDLNEELQQRLNVSLVPLTINLEGKNYRDDKTLDVDEFLKVMKSSKEGPKTACPSPQDFIEEYKGNEGVFVVTMPEKLSGTYKSALLAKDIFIEEFGKKFIHVFDSLSASVGETLVSLKISEFIKKEYGENSIVEKVNSYISGMRTFFMLESLDNLVKAGRVSPLVAKASSILNVKLIMTGTEEGSIRLHEKVMGVKKAFRRLVEIIGEEGHNLEDKILGIAHCNCLEKALEFKKEVLKKYKFKDIIIVKTAGISTVYANDGGIIISF